MYFKLILISTLFLSLIHHEEICKKYENQKHLRFNNTEFQNAFRKTENTNEIIYNKHLFYGGERKDNQYKKFNMNQNGRKPIINYSKELIERRSKKILEESKDKNVSRKIENIKILIEKGIEYLENQLIIYSEPIEDFTFDLSFKNLFFGYIKKFFKGSEKIHLKKFDYFIFFDFDESMKNGKLAINFPEFSFLKYNSRPIITYIKFNLNWFADEIQFKDIMVLVHEFLHSFGLVSKGEAKKLMDKLSNLDEENLIKKYIQEHNDFYKLFTYLKSINKLDKLYKNGHFNPNYLYNDVMQPGRTTINQMTSFSIGLFEILTNYEFRVNRKISKKNYENCLPILKILFKNDCESETIKNQQNNIFKSLDLKKDIIFNNRCSKNNENIAHDICDATFQTKRYCNFNIGDKNPHCYKPITRGNSNCFEPKNNLNSNNFEHYGKKSNCFLVKNLSKNNIFNPYCLKNDIDIENSLIKIFIKNNETEKEVICEYEKNYDEVLEENIYSKKQDHVNFNLDGKEYKVDCPDMNKFYKNNLPNLCDDDCNLNGRCVGKNQCECYRGFNPEDNCKTLLQDFVDNNSDRFNYTIIEGEENASNSEACIIKKNKYLKTYVLGCSKDAENINLKYFEDYCKPYPGCFDIFKLQYMNDLKSRCKEDFRDKKIEEIENEC